MHGTETNMNFMMIENESELIAFNDWQIKYPWYHIPFLFKLWVFADENRENIHAFATLKGGHAYPRK